MVSNYIILLVLIANYMHMQVVQGATVDLHEPAFALWGGMFEFNCTVEGGNESVQSFNWYHNDSLIDTTDQQNLRISTKMNREWPWSVLTVTSAQREDGGEYYCEAVFHDTNETSNRYTLQIKGIFSVHVDVESMMFEAILGSKIELKCIVDAIPTPTVIWSRIDNDKVIQNVVTQNPGDPKYGTLERTVTREDDGKWRCAVSGNFGGKHSDFSITVIVPPANTSILLLTNNTAQRGENFELQCNSNVQHSPKFAWIYNGTNLTNVATQSSNPKYEVNIELGQLTVKGATYWDAGVYTCIVTNRAGSDSANLMVDVEGAPEILLHHFPPQVKMGKLTGGYLNCPFLSNPPPTSVQWKEGSNPVYSGDQYKIFSENGTLFISNLESAEWEIISFTCSIINTYGNDSRTFNTLLVDVPEPPKNFTITPCQSDDHSIELYWTASAVDANYSKEVEEYMLERSLNGGEFRLSKAVFDKNATSGVISGLLPRVTYVFRLRARNLAGLSPPSNNQTCIIQKSLPEDGVSICDCAYEEYYIIGGIVGGVILITMVVIVIILAYGKRRYKKKKTIQVAVEPEEKTKEDQLFKIISNTSNLQMYTV